MPTRLTARWLLPVSDDPIADAALLVGDDGRIADAGPDHAVPTPPGVREIRLGEAALLPGLVNVHAHPELTAMRGLLEDLPFHEWIPALLRAKINARLDGDDYLDCARYGCLEALRAGITTIGATEDSGASLDALIALGMRGVVYREVFGPSPVRADAAMAQLRDNVDAMCERATDLVRVGISPHAPYTVSDRLYVLATELARAERLPVAVHAAESQAEHLLVTHGLGPFADALGRRGVSTPPRAPSTIALLDQLGVLDTRPLLIHCVRLSTDDVSRIAAAGAPVAHCPTANARLGHGIAPVTEMHEAGITVALGTDSVASNNRMDLLEEGRVAQVLQRARLAAPAALPAATLLRMATLDGARALGLDARIGSLERGKDADLCAVAFDAPSVAPVNDPLAALFHSARASDVVLTMVRGRILYDRAATATAPPSDRALAERIGAIASRLRHALRSTANGSG
ncbi:MAG: amidohydrolase family protein, partial [Longimicrobiales bacterium]